MLKRTLGLFGLFLFGCAEPAESSRQETALTTSKCVTIERGRGTAEVADAFIKPNALRKNFGDKPVLRVSSSDEALLRFGLEAIPSSATVTKATLKLYANGEAGDGTILLHRITAPWSEDDVTYGNFAQAFAPGPVAAMRLTSKKTHKSVDVTQVVSSWVRGAVPNYGLELEVGADHRPRRDRDGDDDQDPTLLVSSEGAAGKRPALEVCYSVFEDECADNPCRNGGTCSNGSSGFTCECSPGFGGPTCQDVLDRCADNPCQHGGTCTSEEDRYTCLCPPGYSGTHCETDIDECAAEPCQNGGVCSDAVAGFTCACMPGYDGVNCEHAIDNCEGEPCHNGGSCSSDAGGFSCACADGYSGATCDTNIDDCGESPCSNGTCVDGVDGYTCSCSPDWGGEHCDVNLNRCAQAPCLNGGTCTNGPGTYSCSCAAGYGGVNCELDLDDCAQNPCQNGGVCVDGVASHSCVCPAGYEGDECETPVVPTVRVRINGVCVPICVGDVDPDGNGWGRENGAACIMPSNPVAGTAPWCETPVSAPAYEAPHASVDANTTSVATIPRPSRIEVGALSNCPYDVPGLVPLDPSWLSHGGMLHVPPGTRALVRGNREISASTLIRMLHIPETSELVFADEPGSFRVTDLMVDGALRLGGPTCRLQSNIVFEFDTDEDVASAAVREAIFSRMGLGLMVGESGVLEMFGRLYQPTWTRLSATANAGATTLSLQEAVDWEVGQQLVVATSGHVDYPLADENERRTITAVDGTTVTVNAPLTYRHYGGPEYQVEVGLLSRSLQFRTAPRVVAVAPTFGGHIMVHSKHARVSGVELYGLGQQNFLARYPFHFHRAGDVAGASYFTDSSVWRSNFRCAVIHRTDRALVSRNVAYDNFGHCYYFEDGVELNNELSFNLAVRTKIMGPTDEPSIAAMRWLGQEGFTSVQSADMIQPADRAAAGFYISNGNNRIIGNASSGGFAGYSLPNLPRAIGGSPERIYPITFGVSHFDGNTAHSAGYLWGEGGAGVYVGGTLTEENGLLKYTSGRSTEWDLLRHHTEVFNNTKTFLCETGIVHWGNQPRIVNFEAWNNGLLAKLFGSASIQSSLAVGKTNHVLPSRYFGSYDTSRPLGYWRRGFQFYDTRTQTILSDVLFRQYPSAEGCALLSMTHSSQYTPQQMNAVAGLHFADVPDQRRLCVTNPDGTLSARNFNVIDSDGSLSGSVGAALPAGPRLVASAHADAWRASGQCVEHEPWGAVVCPLEAPHSVASVGTIPNANVRVTTYGLDGASFGQNWYSPQEFVDAQITAPSGIGWHHSFPGGVPESVQLQVLQVPDDSFVLFSLTLPPGVSCSIAGSAWTEAASLDQLLASTSAAYVTDRSTCFVRIPPTAIGSFEASGLSVPNMTWRGNPTPTTYFTLDTGCSSDNAACASVASQLPAL